MRDMELTETGNLVTGNFKSNEVSGIDELVQRLRTRLRVFFGEFYLDATKGIDYFGTIFKKGTTYTEIANTIKREILNTQDILGLDFFELFTDNLVQRKLRIRFQARSTYGLIDEVLLLGI